MSRWMEGETQGRIETERHKEEQTDIAILGSEHVFKASQRGNSLAVGSEKAAHLFVSFSH